MFSRRIAPAIRRFAPHGRACRRMTVQMQLRKSWRGLYGAATLSPNRAKPLPEAARFTAC